MVDAVASPKALKIESSAVFLPEHGALLRMPRAPNRKRPAIFWERFEQHALYYDCFWDENGRDVILIGPAPLNLLPALKHASFRTSTEIDAALDVEHYPSRSALVTVVKNVPKGSEALHFTLEENNFNVQIQPNQSEDFVGLNVMFTMNKNNDLGWIKSWAEWHVGQHGANGIIIHDNGSTDYAISEIEAVLDGIIGLEKYAVVSWPHKYGPHDPAVIFYRFWANFLQVSSFQQITRRMAAKANAILNCDIDELVMPSDDGASVFSLARTSSDGLVVLKGTWIETYVAPERAFAENHFKFGYTHKNKLKSICANKWAIDPSRAWVKSFAVFPMMHRFLGMDKKMVSTAPHMYFFHFKGINTNWKEQRNQTTQNASKLLKVFKFTSPEN